MTPRNDEAGGEKSPKKRVKAIIRRSVQEEAKRHGFVRDRGRFHKDLDGLAWLIEPQHEGFGDEFAEFTLEIGVYVPGVIESYVKAYWGLQQKRKNNITNCCVRFRVGRLTEECVDRWWRLEPDDPPEKDEQIVEELRGLTRRNILPFLERFRTPTDVAAALSDPSDLPWPPVRGSDSIRLAYAGILWGRLGDKQKHAEYLKRAAEVADRSRIHEFKEHIHRVLEREGVEPPEM